MKIEFNKSIAIDADPDKVWSVNSKEFVDIYKWSRNVKSSRAMLGKPVGDCDVAGRICEVPGFGEVHEKLLNFSNEKRALTLIVEKGLPFFIKNSRFETQVNPTGDGGSEFKLYYEMDVSLFPGLILFPMLKAKLNRTVDEILDDLKEYSEREKSN